MRNTPVRYPHCHGAHEAAFEQYLSSLSFFRVSRSPILKEMQVLQIAWLGWGGAFYTILLQPRQSARPLPLTLLPLRAPCSYRTLCAEITLVIILSPALCQQKWKLMAAHRTCQWGHARQLAQPQVVPMQGVE